MDYQSGNLVVSFNSDERIAPASLTKLMSGYVIYSALKSGQINLQNAVIISEKAWQQEGSKMFIEIGAEVKVDDLIMGMVVQSGNDATIALAEHVSGNEADFVHSMNQISQQLGLKNSHFVNASGMPDPNHYMSAYDIALLSRAIIKEFPEEYSRYSKRDFKYNEIQQFNRNPLLNLDPTVDGLKTGYTDTVGYCIAASAKRDQARLISVVLGAETNAARAEVSRSLLDYGFELLKTRYSDDNVVDSKNIITPEKTCTEYECDNTGRCIEVTVPCDE